MNRLIHAILINGVLIGIFGLNPAYAAGEQRELSQAQELTSVYLQTCIGPDRNPFGFEFCVNNNFRTLDQELGRPIGSCLGLQNSSFSYEVCVNEKFRTIERELGLYLRRCTGVDRSPFAYESCVNQNFREIGHQTFQN